MNLDDGMQRCLFCGGDASDPDHIWRCDGRQGRVEAGTWSYVQPIAAQALKDAGQAAQLGNERRAAVRDAIARHIDTLAARDRDFTSDDVYQLAEADDDPLPDDAPMGAMFSAAAKRGSIVAIDRAPAQSVRRNSHRAKIAWWHGEKRGG